MSDLRIISQQELDQHSKHGDLWVVIHGYVFDISKWAESHPGGWEILVDYAKRKEDAGREFEDIKHSSEARQEAMKYLIGKTTTAVKPFPMEFKGKLHETRPLEGEGGNNLLMIGGALVVAAVAAYILMKKKKA